MNPLAQLSDADLVALHKQANTTPDLSHLSDDDLIKAYGASEEPEKEGPVSAAISGLAHGLTFNQSDKIIAGARAGYGALTGDGKMGELYDKYLDEGQGRSRNLAQENPKSYTGAAVGGALLNPVNKFLPGGGLVKNVATGAGVGALMASGESNAHPTESYDQLQRFGGDLYQGAKSGAIGGVLGTAVGAGLKALPGLPKKAAAVLLGAPEDAVERYIANPGAVEAAPTVPEAVGAFKTSVKGLKDRVIDASDKARSTLGPESEMSGQDIANFFQSHIDDITQRAEGAPSPSDVATVKWLKGEQAPFLGENAERTFSGSRLKDLVQNIQAQSKFNKLPGEFSGANQATIKSVGHDINTALKGASPEYAQEMVETARQTDLLKQAQGLFKSDQGLANTLNRVRRERAPFAEDVVKNVDKEFGTDTVEDLRNALAREAFDKAATTPGGSRNVNFYRGILENAFGEGAVGKMIGKAMGATVGGTVDKYGPGMAKGAIDAYRSVADNPYVQNYGQGIARGGQDIGVSPNVTPAIAEYLTGKRQQDIKGKANDQASVQLSGPDQVVQRLTSNPQSLGKYAGPLANAAKRGQTSLAAAHYVMSQNDPEYQKLFNGEENP